MFEVYVSRILPIEDDEAMEQTPLRWAKRMREEVDAIATENKTTRAAVLRHFIQWAIEQYRTEKAELAADKKGRR